MDSLRDCPENPKDRLKEFTKNALKGDLVEIIGEHEVFLKHKVIALLEENGFEIVDQVSDKWSYTIVAVKK